MTPAQNRSPMGVIAEVVAPVEKPAVQPFPLVAVRDIPEIVTQDWLVEGVIPRFGDDGTAGYVFGPSKARKSLLLADFGLSVSTQTPALGRFAVKHRGAVVGFFAEDPKGETSRRVHRLARGRGVEVPPDLFLIDMPAIAIDSPEHQDRLTATLKAIPNLALAWFDPMVRLHRVNDNRAEELGPIHTFLRTLSRALPRTVILLAHHTNHEGGARGSTDYGAFGDFNIFGRKKDRLTTEITAIENRGGPPGRPFAFTIEDGRVDAGATMRLVAVDVEDVEQERSMALEQEIVSFKSSNPGASGKDCQRHLRKLGVSFTATVFWELWKGARL